MADVGHAQHHIDLATAINTYHAAGLDTTIDATPVDWAEGWVHPTAGSDTYDGTTRQTPKATIGAAISAGFRVIHVGAGNHSWTGTSANVTLVFHPGVHTFTNAPVVCTGSIGLVGLTPPVQHVDVTEGSAVLKGNNTTDIFQIGQSSTQHWGGVVRNLKFDAATFTRAALYALNTNMIDVDYNVIYSASWVSDVYLLYTVQEAVATTQDNSWSRVTRNTTVGAALLYTYPGWGWTNRFNVSGNRGYARGGADITNPFIYMEGGNDQGHAITNNSFEGNGPASGVDNIPFIYLPGKHQWLHVAGNAFEHTDSTDRIAMHFGDTGNDIANSVIIASLGDTAAAGYVKINGTTYTTATNIQGTDTGKNQIIIAGRDTTW